MVEGDFWRHARTDLADLYRDRMTLRQAWVRLTTLPPDAAIWAALQKEQDRAEAAQRVRDIDAVLAMVRGGGRHGG